MTGTEIAVRAANAIEKATKKVDNEIARESRRRAESQGGTTIIVGTTLLGLPNRAVAPEEEEEEEEEKEDLGLAGLLWLPPTLRMFSRLQVPLSLVGRGVCCL
jgi:hypothetical protein